MEKQSFFFWGDESGKAKLFGKEVNNSSTSINTKLIKSIKKRGQKEIKVIIGKVFDGLEFICISLLSI